ncbi:MAG: precorrin-2 C(20)-methyltransferase [Alphaproteobacteria bacterium]|nr:precorrin-2 C(20)-methyltransferase [Alphaproteobacteria bacterium]
MAKIYGIGMGPGDAELITVKARDILQNVPVIAYPTPENGTSFVRQIADFWLKQWPQKIELPIALPMKISADRKITDSIYASAAKQIIIHAEQGSDVAILCEGDPFIYGSFTYLFESLQSQMADKKSPHQLSVIAGISSILCSAANMQKPLARQSEPMLIIPALVIDDDFKARIASSGVTIIMKISSRFGALRDLLEEMDLLDDADYIEYASLPQQKIIAMRDADFSHAPYFSLVIIRNGKA